MAKFRGETAWHMTIYRLMRAHISKTLAIGLLAFALVHFSLYSLSAQSPGPERAVVEVDSLIKLSRSLTAARKFDLAFALNDQADSIARMAFGEGSEAYGKCVFNRGRVHHFQGTLEDAATWYRLSADIRRSVLGTAHQDYAWSLNNLAVVLRAQARYKEAEPLFKEVIEVVERVFGNRHAEYAAAQSNLGTLYLSMGEYPKAEPLFRSALVLRDTLLGREHKDYAASQNNMAILCMEMGRYQEAERIYLDALYLREKTQGKRNSDYILALNNLAILYSRMSRLENAEPLYLEALDLREQLQGRDNLEFASGLNNLGALYLKMRRNKDAEPLLKEALDVRKRLLGQEHPDYANTLNNLAFCYYDLGAFVKAEKYFQEALMIKKITLEPDHPNMGSIYHNLGTVYMRMGRNEEAEAYMKQALQVWDKSLGGDHADYGSALSNLAFIKMEQKRFEEAEPLFLKAHELLVSAHGQQHTEVAVNSQNMGLLYFRMGELDRAANCLEKALSIHEKVDGKEHPSYLFALRNLAVTYSRGKKYKHAVPMLEELFANDQRRLNAAMSFLSESELEEYYELFRMRARNSADILYDLHEKGRREVGFSGLAYDQTLFYKGFLLDVSLEMKKRAKADSSTMAMQDALTQIRHRLSTDWIDSGRLIASISELRAQSDSLEKALARRLMDTDRETQTVRWEDVRQTLQDDEAVLEFIHSNTEGPDSMSGFLYSAFLLDKSSKNPVFIPLFREKDLEDLGSITKDPEGYLKRVYGCAGCPGEDPAPGALYTMVWEPILKKLPKNIRRIHYAPSGALHRFNLAAVANGRGEVVSDRFALSLLGSSRDLVLPRPVRSAVRKAQVFGGVRFDAIPELAFSSDTTLTSSAGQFTFRSVSGRQDWNYLPWTLAEAETVQEMLQDKGLDSRMHTGVEATEEAFKALADTGTLQPGILHMATHGYFFPETASDTRSDTDLPMPDFSANRMLRSGLILAGGNHAWRFGSPMREGAEDGILTAYEISQMDFPDLELAVLSACETGLGDHSGYEGVYGLQRAFRLAGARYIIMSLWQVPDWETMAFMAAFYRHLEAGGQLNVKQAFVAAQKEIRKVFPEPRKWAGFVLLE